MVVGGVGLWGGGGGVRASISDGRRPVLRPVATPGDLPGAICRRREAITATGGGGGGRGARGRWGEGKGEGCLKVTAVREGKGRRLANTE